MSDLKKTVEELIKEVTDLKKENKQLKDILQKSTNILPQAISDSILPQVRSPMYSGIGSPIVSPVYRTRPIVSPVYRTRPIVYSPSPVLSPILSPVLPQERILPVYQSIGVYVNPLTFRSRYIFR